MPKSGIDVIVFKLCDFKVLSRWNSPFFNISAYPLPQRSAKIWALTNFTSDPPPLHPELVSISSEAEKAEAAQCQRLPMS